MTISPDRRTLSVSLPELKEGIYTVSWKVFSAVDGHYTQGSYPLGVGNVTLASLRQQRVEATPPAVPSQLEVILRWVTFASQTALMGSIGFLLFVWRPSARHLKGKDVEHLAAADSSVNITLWISLATVAASTISWLPLQVSAVSGSFSQVLSGSRFGQIWILRMIVIGLMALVLYVHTLRAGNRYLLWLLGVSAGSLLLTSSLNSHNAAAPTQFGFLPVISDWIHLVGVGLWVGGLFQLVITISSIYKKAEADGGLTSLLTVLIPRFSLVAVLSFAAIGVTGFFSSLIQLKSLGALFASFYGESLIVKLLLIVPMLLLGAFNTFKIHTALLRGLSSNIAKRFLRSVRLEAGLGVIILLVVSLLTAVPPPPGVQPSQKEVQGLVFTGSSEGVNVELEIYPGHVGINEFTVELSDMQGSNISDVREVVLEFKPGDVTIGPSTAVAKPAGDAYVLVGGYLSMPGKWGVKVQVRRQQAYDAIVNFEVNVGKQPRALKMVEFPLPGSPYDVEADQRGNVWTTLPRSASIGRFEISSQSFEEFKIPEPGALPNMMAIGRDGALWFTDPQGNRVFRFDPISKSFKSYTVPTPQSVPGPVATSKDGMIWFAEVVGNKIAVLNPVSGNITEYPIPRPVSNPLSIAIDDRGYVWFAESRGNRIGRLDVERGIIEEYAPRNFSLSFPAGISVDEMGLVWFAEHGSHAITVLNPENRSFTRYPLKSPSAFPYAVAIDSEGNVWFAEHIGNAIGVLKVRDGSVEEFAIPTPDSNTQWIALDESGNVWFAEADQNKLGVYGSIQEQRPAESIDSFFARVLAVSSAALAGFALFFSWEAWKRIKSSIGRVWE